MDLPYSDPEGGNLKITPVEIRNQEFKRGMRGYDTIEVDTFLELVANEYTTVLNENEQLTKQLIKLEAELKNFKEVEKTLKQTLYNVQETSQISKENSQKEAILLKREAELAASQMIEKARSEVHRMREEVVNLQNQKQSFISRLRHLLSSQLELIDVLEIDDLDRSKLKDRSRKSQSVEKTETTVKKPDSTGSEPEITLPVKDKPDSGAAGTVQKSSYPEEPRKPEKTHNDFFDDIFGDEDNK